MMTKKREEAAKFAEEMVNNRIPVAKIVEQAKPLGLDSDDVMEGFVKIAFAFDRIESAVGYILDVLWRLVEQGVKAKDVAEAFVNEETTSCCAYEIFSKSFKKLPERLQERIFVYAQDDVEIEHHIEYASGTLLEELNSINSYDEYCDEYSAENRDRSYDPEYDEEFFDEYEGIDEF